MASMFGDILRMASDLIKSFVLESMVPMIVAAPPTSPMLAKQLQNIIEKEWITIITFVMMLPLQIIYFLWFLSGGPLMNFSFLTRYFTYIQVAIFIIVMALFRTILVITLTENHSGTNDLNPNRIKSKFRCTPSDMHTTTASSSTTTTIISESAARFTPKKENSKTKKF